MKPVIIVRRGTYQMAGHVYKGYHALLELAQTSPQLRVAGFRPLLYSRLGRLQANVCMQALVRFGLVKAIGRNKKVGRGAIWSVRRVKTSRLPYGHTQYRPSMHRKKPVFIGRQTKKQISPEGVIMPERLHIPRRRYKAKPCQQAGVKDFVDIITFLVLHSDTIRQYESIRACAEALGLRVKVDKRFKAILAHP